MQRLANLPNEGNINVETWSPPVLSKTFSWQDGHVGGRERQTPARTERWSYLQSALRDQACTVEETIPPPTSIDDKNGVLRGLPVVVALVQNEGGEGADVAVPVAGEADAGLEEQGPVDKEVTNLHVDLKAVRPRVRGGREEKQVRFRFYGRFGRDWWAGTGWTGCEGHIGRCSLLILFYQSRPLGASIRDPGGNMTLDAFVFECTRDYVARGRPGCATVLFEPSLQKCRNDDLSWKKCTTCRGKGSDV